MLYFTMSEDKKKPHPLQRAWAAGVFDAKVKFPRSGYVLRFESTDEPLMKRFFETVGIGNLHEADKKTCSHTVYIYQSQNMDDTRELLLLVAPFLSAVRMKQASEMVARIERNPTWQRKNPEKAASSVITPAPNVEAKTTQQSTAADGSDASPPDVEPTGE